MTADIWRLGHRPALDGVRGLAIIVVMIHHAFPIGLRSGGLVGVTLFFTLSGFLIATLLAEELVRCGRVSFRAFYARRARRLLPAIVACSVVLVALGLASPLAGFWSLSYLANWAAIDGANLGMLSHTWSLAIEEQFYLVFPVVIAAGWRRPRLLAGMLTLGILWPILVRWQGAFSPDRMYRGTDLRMDALLIGCALGIVFVRVGTRRWPAIVGIAGVAGLGWLAVNPDHLFHYRYGLALTAVASAMLVGVAATRTVRWLEWGPLMSCGKAAYSLYLWHGLAFHLMADAGLLRAPLSVAASALLAWASMRWVEEPWRRRATSRMAAQRAGSPLVFLPRLR